MNEPIAEQTKMGRVIMSPGRYNDLVNSLYTRTSVSDFDRLYKCIRSGRESR